jgi:hypothetical protein
VLKADYSPVVAEARQTPQQKMIAKMNYLYPLEEPSEEAVVGFIHKAAEQYGQNPRLLERLAYHESRFQVNTPNTTDSNAAAGNPSNGPFQFTQLTFGNMAPQAMAANPEAWASLGVISPNWRDWRHQALAAPWAIEQGYGPQHWTAFPLAVQDVESQVSAPSS